MPQKLLISTNEVFTILFNVGKTLKTTTENTLLINDFLLNLLKTLN